MIRNRNLVFGTVVAADDDADKYFMLPKLATADLPTAASSNEGGIAYDTTLDKVVFSDGSSWIKVGYGAGSPSPSLSPSASPSS